MISVGKLVNKGAKVTFDETRGYVVECEGIVATVAKEKDGLYRPGYIDRTRKRNFDFH